MAVSRKKSLGPEGPATRVLRNRRQKTKNADLAARVPEYLEAIQPPPVVPDMASYTPDRP
ncbi:hypothetical protein [Lysobacter gummosus]|uniref:hypothetical protein n=1 Tax=Lysobacter gummosus TaxID=262324 RepID=UPI0036389BC8